MLRSHELMSRSTVNHISPSPITYTANFNSIGYKVAYNVQNRFFNQLFQDYDIMLSL